MGSFSIWHWLIVLAVVLVLFGGKGKISSLMGDFGKGLKSFKKNMGDDSADASEEAPQALERDATRSGTADATPAEKDPAANS